MNAPPSSATYVKSVVGVPQINYLQTGVLQTYRPQPRKSPRSPIWRSKCPAQLGGPEANGSCHDVVVATDGVPLPREMPQNTRFGLKSTFRVVVLLLMGCPTPCSASAGVVLASDPPHPQFSHSRRSLQNSSTIIVSSPCHCRDRRLDKGWFAIPGKLAGNG